MASITANKEITREDNTIKPRAYQTEMLEESLKRNVIVAMDTNSGKTHVATMRIQKELEVMEPGKIIWFLTPTVQLCLQQLAVLKSPMTSVQIDSLTSLDKFDKWLDKGTWDTLLSNTNIIVSTYAVLCDAAFHAFVKVDLLALIVFDEAHNCIGNSPGSKLMKEYYWPLKQIGGTVPHILGLTASPVIGSDLEDFETLESILDAKCTIPREQKVDLALHVKLPTSLEIPYDAEANSGTHTHIMVELITTHVNLNIHEDPEILRLRNTTTEAAKSKLEEALMKKNTFAQRQMKSFIRTSGTIHHILGDWAADAYISEVISSFIQCIDSKNTKFLEWEDSEKQYLADALRRLGSVSDKTSIFSDASISHKARTLIQYLSACDERTIGIVFVDQRAIAYMLYFLLSEHQDTRNLFRFGMVVGASKPQVGKHDICDFSHHEDSARTLEKFRTGEINILIATSVIEEGIDVPKCNLVVCFDELRNLKSFIQRRGRARLPESKFIVMLEKASKNSIDKWKNLEHQMKLQYEQADSSTQTQANLEETEMEQKRQYRFRVEITNALLDLDTAKSHLECFCSRLSSRFKSQLKPEYSFVLERYEGAQSETPLFKAKVILPVTLDHKFRVHESRDLWRSKKKATKEAAFRAYVALYHAGLVNDHLLPLTFTESSDHMEAQDSVITVQQQFNPWPLVAQAWEDEDKLQGRVLTLKDETGLTKCQIQMQIPTSIPSMKTIRIFFSFSSEWKIEVGPATTIQHSLVTRPTPDDTGALLSLSYGHRWNIEQLRHILQFKVVHMELNSFSKQELSSISTDRAIGTIGLLRDPQNHDHPYLFHKWLSTKPPLESIQKPHKDHEGFSQDQPFVAVKKWSRRSDFLHPAPPDPTPNESPSAEYFTVFPQSLLEVDTIPVAVSQFGLLIPSILHNIEIQLVVKELCTTLLSEIENLDFELIRIAISAPVAREPENYQKLEFLGDSVLKFFISIFVASKYPYWPEGYLSDKKAALVSNSRLCRAGLDRGLDKFILTTPFTGKKWRPIYVETELDNQENSTREMSTKTIADVVESLIGAAWKMDDSAISLSIAKVFLPEVDLPGLEVGRLRLFEIAEANLALPAPLYHVETLAGYTFKKKSLLVQSMSHSSHSSAIASYDRLEFLGDAILDIIIVTELMKYEEEISHSRMHLYKTCLVNGDYLSFIALEWNVTQKKPILKEDTDSGAPVEETTKIALPLWRFMRHELYDFENTQREVGRRHVLLRDDIIHALESGKEYPWSFLARLGTHKFYSDLVESLLGAVWVDSGSLDACQQLLDRMGILKLLHRLVKDNVHGLHPREELRILAKGKEVTYEVQFRDGVDAGGELLCKVCVGEDQIIEVAGGISKEEVKTRAAEGAVALLRNANGRSGSPINYGGEHLV